MKKKPIASYLELRKMIPDILAEHGKNPEVTRAALANPILAFEYLGFDFTPDFRRLLEYRIRLGPENQEKLIDLEQKIFKKAGKEFDLRSPKEVNTVLNSLIKQVKANQSASKEPPNPKRFNVKPLPRPLSSQNRDPLEKDKGFHPIIPLLLEYRKIEASVSSFSDEALFKELLENHNHKDHPLKFSNVQFNIKTNLKALPKRRKKK